MAVQTYKDCKYIIFDDCSSDDTYGELLRCTAGDPRFRVVRNEVNLGFTRSMKLHLQRVEGNYIAVHGSGDISHPERIERQKQFLDENPDCVVVACKTRKLDKYGNARPVREKHGWVTQSQLLVKNQFFHGDVMYRRTAYQSVGGYRDIFPVAADYDLWLRLMEHGNGYILPEVLYTAHTPPDTISLDLRKRIEQKIVVGYCRKITLNSLIIGNADELKTIDLSDDRLLKEDFRKLFKSAVKNLQFGSAFYIARRHHDLFGSIF